MRKKIIIDPGHGGTDPGAIGFGVREADVAIDLAGKVADRLSLHTPAPEVLYTHRGEGKSLMDRAICANNEGADLFVSIHCNAFSSDQAHGFEIFTSPGVTRADEFATSIFNEVEHTFPNWTMRSDWTDGDPDKEAAFAVLTRTSMPAVLIEFGFITNPVDHFIITDGPTSRLLTSAVSHGIMGVL